MDSAGLRWYRTGTVDITQGSTNVTGVGTNWQTAGIQPGDVFMVGNSVLYEIADVGDNTNIVLQSAFQGATGTAQNYSILRNFAGTMQAQIAAQVSELVNKYESYIDTELEQIVGPAGPTSFPYRGTWATGRQYNALDVVEYGGALYMAIAGHTSTSTNAPGAPDTEWMPLSVSLSGTVLTAFAKGASVNPNGASGISIVGKNDANDVTLSATADAIRLQQTAGGTTTTLASISTKPVVSKDVTLYVSANGNDATGDGTSSKPYATINHALSQLGDVLINCKILVEPGTYNLNYHNGDFGEGNGAIYIADKVGTLEIAPTINSSAPNIFFNVTDNRDANLQFGLVTVIGPLSLRIGGFEFILTGSGDSYSGIYARYCGEIVFETINLYAIGKGMRFLLMSYEGGKVIQMGGYIMKVSLTGVLNDRLSTFAFSSGGYTSVTRAQLKEAENNETVYGPMYAVMSWYGGIIAYNGNNINVSPRVGVFYPTSNSTIYPPSA